MAEIFEVSQINEYLRQRFEADEFLGSLLIRGELSNYKIYPSGHHYFTLKDSQSAIRCVMFKGSAMRLRFRPETGMKVIAGGRIAVFPRDGAYQLYCTSLTPEGVGDLHVAFEQLKLKLQAEGLFARERKQALPRFPHRIAIITSSAGAALHDMLRILAQALPADGGQAARRPRAGGRGSGGDRRGDPLRQPLGAGRPHHHRTRRRLHGGPLGLQRRTRGPRHYRFAYSGHLGRRP